jgi:5-methylcytosine-specific restriction protein A
LSWSRKSRHERGYGAEWEKTRKRVLERDSGLCQACARKDRVALGREVHHKKPRAQGGSDEDSNLETLCHECHLEADATVQGRKRKRKMRIGLDGYPIA